jgi:hypothetical protein
MYLRVSRALFLCLMIGSVLAGSPSALSAEATVQTNRIMRLHFQTNSVGETVVQYGEKVTSSLTNAQHLLNFTKLAEIPGATISLIPQDAMVVVTSEQFPDWIVQIPPKQTARFSWEYEKRTAHVQASDLNREAIHLSFPDGGTAEMEAQAEGRYEVMDDGTYAFFGAGKLTGINADGVTVQFGYVFPPMFGGKLIAPPANNPNGRFTRATPVAQLTFVGQIESGLSVRVGSQTVPLEPGATNNIRAENGAQISLQLNPATHTVDWAVERGIFRVNVEGFHCWKSLAASGQTAAMQWSTNGVMVELKNKNGKDAFQKHVLVSLSSTLNVAIGESATFQYGRATDCSTFFATASGGETVMYNAETARFVRLDEGNMNFVSGSPESTTAPTRHYTPVRLIWTTNDKVEFKSATETLTVGLAGHEIFHADASTELDVNYYGPPKLTVRVEAGAAAISPNFMPRVTVELVEGSAVTFGYDADADIFRIEPADGNLSPIAIRTETGFYPRVMPGTRITFVINRSPFLGDGGDVIFNEVAGAGRGGGNGIPYHPLPPGRPQPPIEPPVTTLE